MSGANDKKINDLIAVIADKKKALGVKPRAAWKTNGILKYEDSHVNINVSQLDACVKAVAYLLKEQDYHKRAVDLLGVTHPCYFDDHLDDFKLRASILKWDEEKRKLDALEKKLKDLRSEDAKTVDALDDIMTYLESVTISNRTGCFKASSPLMTARSRN